MRYMVWLKIKYIYTVYVKRLISYLKYWQWESEYVNFQWKDEARFVPDQHAELDIYSASSLKQQSAGRHIAPLWHIILNPSQPVFALSP